MNKDILFANGCSFTWGGALEPWFMFVDGKPLGDIIGYDTKDFTAGHIHKMEQNTAVREKIVWPHHLGNLLGCQDVINLGTGCGSNQRIIRTTLDWLSSQSRETLDRTTAVIQLTEPSRYEYYLDDFEEWTLNKAGCVLMNPDCGSSRYQQAQDLNDRRLATYTTTEGIYKFVSDCMTINQIMSSFDMEYRIWSMGYPFSLMDDKFKHFEDLIDKTCSWINQTTKWSVYNNMESLKAPNGKIPVAPASNCHPSVEGHKELAKILYFYMLVNS